MSGKRRNRQRLAIVMTAVLALVLALAVFVGTGLGAGKGNKTLQVWLSGDLTQATPGSPYKKWVDLQVKRFQAKNPGWDVKFTLLTYDPAQQSAKLAAAFGSHNVPDLMSIYTGQFTNTYAKQLLPLNSLINKTPGLYKSISQDIWDMECTPAYDCKGGKSPILGVPWNSGTYFLYYNKDLLKQAGISGPPATYKELFADCLKLSAKGITAFALGANDGYDTSNIWTTNLVSTLKPGDIQKILNRKLPYNAPALVAALEPVLKLTDPASKCTSKNALGEGQVQGTQDFQAGKAAMTGFYSLSLKPFEAALGSKLGIAKEPLSGTGPLLHVNSGYAGNPFDGWVIPKDSKNADVAWSFIKIASDATANKTSQSMMGFSPANGKVIAGLTNPLEKAAAKLANNPAIFELDQLMPNAYALNLYRQFSLGQEGKQSAAKTLAAVEAYAKANP